MAYNKAPSLVWASHIPIFIFYITKWSLRTTPLLTKTYMYFMTIDSSIVKPIRYVTPRRGNNVKNGFTFDLCEKREFVS